MVATIFTLATLHNNNGRHGMMTQQQRGENLYQQQRNNQQQNDDLSHNVLNSYLQLRRSIISMIIYMITMAVTCIRNAVTASTKILEMKITTSIVANRQTSSSSLRRGSRHTLEEKAKFLQKKLNKSSAGKIMQRSSMTMLTI